MRTLWIVLGILAVYSSATIAQQAPIVLENPHVRYTISAEGKNLAFVDRATGVDYLKHDAPSVCALARCKGVEYPITSARSANGQLSIEFGQAKAKVVLHIESRDSCIQLTVDSVSGDNIESIDFLNVPLTLQGRPAEPFGACALWHHFWQYRTRWQAWDYPQRGHKRFIDLHADSVNGGLLLPLHLGWWNFQQFNPPQVEPTYPDVIEYLGAKLIGWDDGINRVQQVHVSPAMIRRTEFVAWTA